MVEMADKDLALTPEELDAAKGFFSWIKSQDDGYSIMPGMAKNDRDFFKIRQIARNNLNKFSNADYAKRSQSVFANLNI
jgi:hypothetical protein